jgi:hypothetical protein
VRKYVIEDTNHAEPLGEFVSLADAVNELHRLGKLPWDQPPNVAPCTNWQTCGRSYEIIEYATDSQPWQELRRIAAFEISAQGVRWSTSFAGDVT